MTAAAAKVRIPKKLVPMLSVPRGTVQYRNAWGGRGSGKSRSFAKAAAVFGYAEKLRILATRDIQGSVRESFHAELKAAIEADPFLAHHYDVGVDYLRGRNGTEFIFRGLRHTNRTIKSLSHIDLTIVEEAEEVTESSWQSLEATVLREPNSEIWSIWNPLVDGSPVDLRFRKHPPDNALTVEMQYTDNEYFPEGLEKLRLRDQILLDANTYAHIWEGAYLEISERQVLGGKVRVRPFKPGEDWNGPYHGLDWGFAQDPTAVVRCWIYGDCLYVEHEAGGVGMELDDTAKELSDGIPDLAKYDIRADSSRPESISHVRRKGLPRLQAAHKWPGSVEDGVAHLRAYKWIIIHPRCKETIRETRLYCHKVDRLSQEVLPDIIDAYNHYIDAIRYALQPMIKQRSGEVAGTMVPGL